MPLDRRNAKIAVTSLIGASIEWYDFFIYGTASALVFPQLFFPAQERLVATLLSFATFGVAFVARPLGGAVFGHLGDNLGRKKTLVTALTLMGVVSTLIGLLPSYATLGASAPVLLVVLRFLQGIAVGGQQGGVILLATENAPPHRRGFYGSFASAGAAGGIILANVAFLLTTSTMSSAAFLAWGWRVPFLASLLIVGLAVFVQRGFAETAESRAAATSPDRSPVLQAVRHHPRAILLAAGCYLAINLTYYVFVTFVVSYATDPKLVGLPRSTVLGAVLVASVVSMVALPLAGLLSDRYGRTRVYVSGAASLGVFSFAFWPLVDTGSAALLTVAMVIGLGVLHSVMYGGQSALFSETFPAAVRYSGVSLGIQLGSVLGGAFAPFIATALLAAYGSSTPVAVYMAAGCAVTVVCTLVLRRTAHDTAAVPSREPVPGA